MFIFLLNSVSSALLFAGYDQAQTNDKHMQRIKPAVDLPFTANNSAIMPSSAEDITDLLSVRYMSF